VSCRIAFGKQSSDSCRLGDAATCQRLDLIQFERIEVSHWWPRIRSVPLDREAMLADN
jgi:hypothetical protein